MLAGGKRKHFYRTHNPKILSITAVRFDEYFGFTDGEVKEMLEYYNLANAYDLVKSWYGGYQFGNVNVYCPWDVFATLSSGEFKIFIFFVKIYCTKNIHVV